MEHTIERSVLMTTGDVLKEVSISAANIYNSRNIQSEMFGLKTIAENERDHIIRTLRWCGAKISGPRGAAEILGVAPSTLNSKMNKLGIKRDGIFGE